MSGSKKAVEARERLPVSESLNLSWTAARLDDDVSGSAYVLMQGWARPALLSAALVRPLLVASSSDLAMHASLALWQVLREPESL